MRRLQARHQAMICMALSVWGEWMKGEENEGGDEGKGVCEGSSIRCK